VGFDVHPLAVSIASATYLLAIRDLLEETNLPIRIPVYRADALFLPDDPRGSVEVACRRRFDLIVGNPPWLSYRYIADPEYQAEVKKRAIEDHAIAPRQQKLLTHMELASVFLIHALAAFGKEGARLGFIMPRSVFSADQHAPLRVGSYKASVALTGFWDLLDVRPLFNVPSCVLFARKTRSTESNGITTPLRGIAWRGRLSQRDVTWSQAAARLRSQSRIGRVVWLGSRSAFATTGRGLDRASPSAYLKRFHQGATIVPRNFYFIKLGEFSARIDPDCTYFATTDPVQAREAKAPYSGVELQGTLPGAFLFRTAIAKNVLPFLVVDPALVVLPVVVQDHRARVCSSEELERDGWRDCGAWMSQAETLWNKLRERKAKRQSLCERLDYQRGLTSQDLALPYVVLYNATGTNLSAAVFARKDCNESFFVDAKLYHFGTRKREEANYLAAILNSGVVNELIKPFQSVGLLGERDIHKKVLELPIPLFDPKNPRHAALAHLGAKARTRARHAVAENRAAQPASLAARRAILRASLRHLLDRIEEEVEMLFGLAN
jgi:hypothetical protein